MEPKENFIYEFVQSNLIVILLGVGGLIFLGYGAFQMLAPGTEEIIIEKAQSADASVVGNAMATQKEIAVDVEGAVEKPGVYHLSVDARQQDALIAAGGMSKSADRSIVAKTLNMAAKLSDGMKIYIPRLGESLAVMTTAGTQQVAGLATSSISVNTGSAAELDSLPGIGVVTANKIISNRPYGSLDELTSKKAVSRSVFEKIKDKISL